MIDTNKKKLEAVSEGIMRVSEAAVFLSVSKDVIHDLMDSGELEYVDYTKPTNVRRVRRPTRKSVMEYAANRVVLTGGE